MPDKLREALHGPRSWLWFPYDRGMALPDSVMEEDLGGGYVACYLDGKRIAYRYRHNTDPGRFGYYLPPDSPYLPE